jgi:hypothetical protein
MKEFTASRTSANASATSRSIFFCASCAASGRWRFLFLPERVVQSAKAPGFVSGHMRNNAPILQALTRTWRAERTKRNEFADFEAALVRYASTLRRPRAQARTGNKH